MWSKKYYNTEVAKRIRVLAFYHGKGEGKEDKEIEIAKYLHAVDHGLNEVLDDFSTPLVIALVEYICAHFQQISSQSE